RTEVDKALRQMARQLDRLLDAYQHGAISVEELKARRERLAELEAGTRARAEALTATEGERERLDRVTTDLVAFAATLRDGLAQLFAGRERLVRLFDRARDRHGRSGHVCWIANQGSRRPTSCKGSSGTWAFRRTHPCR